MTRVHVKICGITRPEEAELAARLGADAIGFVLWERRPRRVSIADAAAIARYLPAFVTRVGVVVDMPADEVSRAIRDAGLGAIQLHGDEDPLAYLDVGARIIKAVAPETDADLARALAMPPQVTLLVDAPDREARGGTGRQADWSRAARLARERRVVLAGGLTPGKASAPPAPGPPRAGDVVSGLQNPPGGEKPGRLGGVFAGGEGAI